MQMHKIPDFRLKDRNRASGLKVKSSFLPSAIFSPLYIFTLPITLSFGILSAIFGLFLSPFGYTRRNAFRLWRTFSPIASMICIAMLITLLFFPSIAETNHSYFSGGIGYIAFAAAMTGVLSSCFNGLRILGVLVFWIFTALTIGKFVFGAPPSPNSQIARHEAKIQRQIEVHGLEFEDIPEMQAIKSVKEDNSYDVSAPGYQINLDRISPAKFIDKIYGKIENSIDNKIAGATAKINNTLQPVDSLMKDLNIDHIVSTDKLTSNIGFESSVDGLPDSAFFPTQNLKGRKFYGAAASKDDSIQGQIMGFLGLGR